MDDLINFFKSEEVKKDLAESFNETEQKRKILEAFPYYENVFGLKDRVIYRIEKLDHMKENLKQCVLYFKHPSRWGDRFDSIFVRVPLQLNGITAEHDYRDEYFCQCWSSHNREAMWQIYNTINCGRGVMFVSTVNKIMRAIWDQSDDAIHIKRWAGEVMYVRLRELIQENFFEKIYGNAINVFESSCKGLVMTFLFKQDFYEHEKEIRFIAHKKSCKRKEYALIKVQGQWKDIIDKVITDPRANEEFVKEATTIFEPYEIRVESNLLQNILPAKYTFRA